MPASSSSLMTVVDDDDPVLGEWGEVPGAPAGLWECLQKLADPRKPRGVRHPIAGIVALALAATLAGAQSFVAIDEWVADVGDTDLAVLGIEGTLPSESTIRRALQRLDPARLDALIGAWMWLRTHTSGQRRVIAVNAGPRLTPFCWASSSARRNTPGR